MQSDLGRGTREARLVVRPARLEDASAIARIYNQGIEERIATFETEPRTVAQMAEWLREKEGHYPVIVAERDGRVLAWAGVGSYRPRPCYNGVAEFFFYTVPPLGGLFLLTRRGSCSDRHQCFSAAQAAARNDPRFRFFRLLGGATAGVRPGFAGRRTRPFTADIAWYLCLQRVPYVGAPGLWSLPLADDR